MIIKRQVQLDEMAALVRRAARDGRPIDEVVRGLWQSLLSLGHPMLRGYVEGVGVGDVGVTMSYERRS